MVFNNNLLLAAASAAASGGDTPYVIDNSLVVSVGDTPEIIMPNADNGGLKWTMSVWFKLGSLNTSGSGDANRYTLVSVLDGSSNGTVIEISSSGESKQDQIDWKDQISGGAAARRNPVRVFRDPTGWYHVVCHYDSANTIAGSRMTMWINGEKQTVFNNTTDPNLNQKSQWGGSTEDVDIFNQANARYWDGYVSQFVWIYNQDYTASNFGEYDTNGVWIPKDLSSLTFTSSTKSFYLDFADSSDLDKDVSGLGNNGTGTTGITSSSQVVDTPSN